MNFVIYNSIIEYEIQINLVNEVRMSIHYLFSTWWHYLSFLGLQLCWAFPPCIVTPITCLHHSNFHTMSLGRSRSLNALVSCHGLLSGSVYTIWWREQCDVLSSLALSRNEVKRSIGESTFVCLALATFWYQILLLPIFHEFTSRYDSTLPGCIFFTPKVYCMILIYRSWPRLFLHQKCFCMKYIILSYN